MSYIEFEDPNGFKYRVDQNGILECLPCQSFEPITISYSGLEKTDIDSVLEKLRKSDRNFKEPIIFTTSTKEEKKMSKFKVGDIVRIKSVDEMWKSNRMLHSMEEFAETYHRITKVDIFTDETLYVLKDCSYCYFDETMLEDRVYTKDDIFDINVIVPNKVVEIEFCDGKEKMICHKEDTFDLRKCCFIAIAKHLYKKEYTYEGIEYMAEHLMYQKKYVKIVDKAMKEYQRTEDEKVKKIHKEEEEKIIRDRQKARRLRQKERRRERIEAERNAALKDEREEMISIIADAINKAKADRKHS